MELNNWRGDVELLNVVILREPISSSHHPILCPLWPERRAA